MYDPSQLEQCQSAVLDTATTFAQVLSSTLRVLLIRGADRSGPRWSMFDLSDGMLVGSDL